MIDAFSSAITGLRSAASTVANAVSSIVNASSTAERVQRSEYNSIGADRITFSLAGRNASGVGSTDASVPTGDQGLTAAIIDTKMSALFYAADATVIKTLEKNEKSLLDILK